MNSHRLCDLFNACNTPDVRQLCPGKLFFRPLLWFWVYTNLHCLTPPLSLVKLLYVPMPQGEFWVMTSTKPWCGDVVKKTGVQTYFSWQCFHVQPGESSWTPRWYSAPMSTALPEAKSVR